MGKRKPMLKISEDQQVPLPTRERKVPQQVEINADLIAAVDAEIDRRGLKKRDVFTWGLKQWLVINNPKAAAQLGYMEE